MLEVLYHRAKFGGVRISPAAGVAKNVEFFCLFVCLFACLSVTLLNVRDCAPLHLPLVQCPYCHNTVSHTRLTRTADQY